MSISFQKDSAYGSCTERIFCGKIDDISYWIWQKEVVTFIR